MSEAVPLLVLTRSLGCDQGLGQLRWDKKREGKGGHGINGSSPFLLSGAAVVEEDSEPSMNEGQSPRILQQGRGKRMVSCDATNFKNQYF